jgi:hypothetical protein
MENPGMGLFVDAGWLITWAGGRNGHSAQRVTLVTSQAAPDGTVDAGPHFPGPSCGKFSAWGPCQGTVTGVRDGRVDNRKRKIVPCGKLHMRAAIRELQSNRRNIGDALLDPRKSVVGFSAERVCLMQDSHHISWTVACKMLNPRERHTKSHIPTLSKQLSGI